MQYFSNITTTSCWKDSVKYEVLDFKKYQRLMQSPCSSP